jgi:hypothetical protein
MSTIDPVASRLYNIAQQLGTTNRRVVEHDEKGRITSVADVPTNVPRLVEDGIALMRGAWPHKPGVDAQGRFEQLDAMRVFAAAVADHVPEQAASMREYHRQATNAIRLNYDDPRA